MMHGQDSLKQWQLSQQIEVKNNIQIIIYFC